MDKGEPDFNTPAHIQEAATRAMKDGFTHYGNAYGDPELREAICFGLNRDYGVERTPDEVLVTNGGIEAINVLSASFLNPGDEVLILDPEYSAYADSVRLFGGVPVFVPLEPDLSINMQAVEEAVSPRTKFMILSNPCNPTSKVMRKSEVDGLAELALKHDVLLIVDEVYSKLIYDGFEHRSVCQIEEIKDRAILLNSFSKTYAMTGWRVGYLVADSPVIKTLLGFHKALLTCVSSPSQKACVAAIRGPQDCVVEMRDEYAKRRQVMLKWLQQTPGITPGTSEGAFYYFPSFSHALSSKELTSYLYDQGVLVRSGTEFGENGEGHIRIAYAATPLDRLDGGMEKLQKALERIG